MPSRTAIQPVGESKRFTITYFDGANSSVGPEMSKKEEPYYVENARSSIIGIIESRNGYSPVGNSLSATANLMTSGLRSYTGAGKGVFRIATVGGTTSIYSLDATNFWVKVVDIASTANGFSTCEAEGNLFMVNGDVLNSYLKEDGTTYVTSADATGHLFGSPTKAKLVNYFKDKLYMANYSNTVGTVRFPYAVWMSSLPLGIVGLVDGDHDAGVTVVNVTDTKYIRATDTLEIRRGTVLVATLSIISKTNSTITLSAPTGVALLSADEVWVPNTFSGQRVWRWSDNASGDPTQQYDTFRVGGDQRGEITGLVNVGDNQVILTPESFSVWNNVQLMNGEFGVGCLSRRGWARCLGSLYFISSLGLHRTIGAAPELISTPIRRIFQGATKAGLESAVMGVIGESILAYIGPVTVYRDDGSINKAIAHCMVEYDVRQENFYVHSLPEGLETMASVSLDNQSGVLLASGDATNHDVVKLMDGEADGSSFLPIPFRVDTPALFLNSIWERYVHPWAVTAHVLRGGPVKVFASLDDEPFFELGAELTKGVSTVWFAKGNEGDQLRCRKLRLSFRVMTERQVRLGRVSVDFFESPEIKINDAQDVT